VDVAVAVPVDVDVDVVVVDYEVAPRIKQSFPTAAARGATL
jgi:hypothetical protein